MSKNSIADLTSRVFDTKRRGNPRPGCDCVQCFGYCQVDRDEVLRDKYSRLENKVVAAAGDDREDPAT